MRSSKIFFHTCAYCVIVSECSCVSLALSVLLLSGEEPPGKRWSSSGCCIEGTLFLPFLSFVGSALVLKFSSLSAISLTHALGMKLFITRPSPELRTCVCHVLKLQKEQLNRPLKLYYFVSGILLHGKIKWVKILPHYIMISKSFFQCLPCDSVVFFEAQMFEILTGKKNLPTFIAVSFMLYPKQIM